MILIGKLFEVGDLENGPGRGIRLGLNGETVEITGMTEEECREVAKSLGEWVTVEILPSKGEVKCQQA